MQAVILAGGLATRLLPRSENLPKSLISVAGRPFIDWQLELLAKSGLSRVVLCIGHLGAQLRAHVGDGARFGLSVTYSEDGPTPLGTAGALRRALALLEPLTLVTYGDSYLPFDYRLPLLDLRAHPEALGSMSVFANRGQWDTSNTRVVGERVLEYSKRPSADCEYIDYGALALRREVIATLPEAEPAALDTLQAELAARGQLRALPVAQRFYEIGSESGISDLERYLARP